MAQARDRLQAARELIDSGHAAAAISAAYYAMLNAARAALSEHDEYAKTHGGTWSLFSRRFVATGAFDAEIYRPTGRAQEARQEGDYEAAPLSIELAAEIGDDASRFIDAVEEMLGGSGQ
jgi:uncharacterized protein (UPF0332 family)